MTGPAIRVRGLGRRFGSTVALAGLDLDVPRGCVFGYIGPNGAGKTTTIKILTGLLEMFDGDAVVAGVDVRLDPKALKRRVGYLPENAAVFEGLTATEHLQLVGRLRGMPEGRLSAVTRDLLDAFGLGGRAHGSLGSFSKGMRQKVVLASALLHDPEVLFLDEPLSGLDVDSALLVKDLVRAFADRGRTVFYSSHMMDVVERVCDRIVILDRGRVVADGSFDELKASAAQGSLEDVFRSLTRDGTQDDRAMRILDAIGRGGGGGSEP